MGVPKKLKGRYELREVLGQGGMGVVYRAWDMDGRRDVALKTLRDSPDSASLDLFEKECEVLKSISHPNIVDIFDLGEFEENGERKPFFVMPLLPGMPLDKIIRGARHRLTVERTVEIMSQTCRGLQAAHERGLVHRDLKPSNIFVMSDDSVKIIDFGIAHLVGSGTMTGQKGTLLFMSPEQVERKAITPLSDIFALGVVCYEMLTQKRPFERDSETRVVDAILSEIPPPASEVNPSVNPLMSRVVHKAMAKQPWNRFASAREFAEALQKALRNEPIEAFDTAKIQPRISRATKAYEDADYDFAGEILTELESEGYWDPAMTDLRQQVSRALRRKKIRQLLDTANARFDEGEDPLALQKIEEVFQLDPENLTAISLKGKIESRRSERQVDSWLRLAQQHIDNHSYNHARDALQNVFRLIPKERRALQLLSETDCLEQEYLNRRQEKKQLYDAAMDAWHNGEVSSALKKLEVVIELDRSAPDSTSSGHANAYQNLYNKVRSEHDAIQNAYAEGRKHLADRDLPKVLAICDQCLTKYPGHALFQALRFEAEEQRRQQLSAHIAEVDDRIEKEPDLSKRIGILQEALQLYPAEQHFERALKLETNKNELVESLVAKATRSEERGQFDEALGQWEILRTIYSKYPGLDFEVERVQKRKEQRSVAEARSRVIKQIDNLTERGDLQGALDQVERAKTEWANDSELVELEKVVRQRAERAAEAQQLVIRGQELCAQGRFDEGVAVLRQAYHVDERKSVVRAALIDALLEQARKVLDTDWRAAQVLAEQALALDSGHSLARSLRALALDRKREESLSVCLSKARRLQGEDNIDEALAEIDQGLTVYPSEPRLLQARDSLRKLRPATDVAEEPEQTVEQEDKKRNLPLALIIAIAASVLILVALGVVGIVRWQARHYGTLMIVSNSPGAQVSVDREAKGKTDSGGRLQIDKLAPGDHVIQVLLPGYDGFEARSSVQAAQTSTVVANLARADGSVEIVSNAGADVLVDGENKGKIGADGRLDIPQVVPGSHQVGVSLQGYIDYQASIDVTSGQTTPVTATLQPVSNPHERSGGAAHAGGTVVTPPIKLGQLAVSANVEGAVISINGKTQPDWRTPHTFAGLTPGAYKIAVKKGDQSATQNVTVAAGSNSTATLALPASVPDPGVGDLDVTSDPAGAQILLNGSNSGSVTPHNFTGLHAGTYKVAMLKEGYESANGTFNVEAGKSTLAKLSLLQPTCLFTLETLIQSGSDWVPVVADVFIDGKPLGQSPVSTSLAVGKHHWRVVAGSKTDEGDYPVHGMGGCDVVDKLK